jgi:DNA-binding PadR family transcriptional regulator
MRPLNYAILKLFETGEEYDGQSVMAELKGEYSSFRAFKPAAINESLLSAEKNGLLDAVRYDLDDKQELHVYYKATEYGESMIKQYIK